MGTEQLLGLALIGGVGYYALSSGAVGGQQKQENSFGAGGVSGFSFPNNFGQSQRSFRGAVSPSETPSKKTTRSGEPSNTTYNYNFPKPDFSGFYNQSSNFQNNISQTKKQQTSNQFSNLNATEQKGFRSGKLSISDVQNISRNKTKAKKEIMIKASSNLFTPAKEFSKKYGKTKSQVRAEAGIPQPTISATPSRNIFQTIGGFFGGLF